MKRLTYLLLLSIALTLSTCNVAYAQSRTNRIFRPCPASTTPASVSISSVGAITISPCSGQTLSLPAGTTFGGGGSLTSGSVLFAGSNGEIAQDNSNFFWDDGNNFLVLGATTRQSNDSRFEAASSAITAVTLRGLSNAVNGYAFSGSLSSPTAVGANIPLIRLDGYGRGSTIFSSSLRGSVQVSSAEAWTDAAHGTYVSFVVTPIGSTTASHYARLYSTSFNLGSGTQFGWSSAATTPTSIDTGLTRQAAGVIRATDGSTAIRGLIGGGTAVASAAALPLPTGRVFHVTGTTNITSITSTNFASGVCITLIFDGVLTFTDGNNLVLAGNFVTTADDTISLCYDGTNWYETGRSVN